MRKIKKSEKKHVVGGVNTGGLLGDGILKEPVATNRMLRWPRGGVIPFDPKG